MTDPVSVATGSGVRHATGATAFRYRAATAAGAMVEGVLRAPSRSEALEELRRQRLVPVSLEASADTASGTPARWRRTDVGAATALWARTLGSLVGAGIPLDRALAFATAQARAPALAATGEAIRGDVQGGAPLSDAMRRHPAVFAPIVVAMVASGEERGALGEALDRAAAHLEERNELRAQVRAALVYPMLVAAATLVGTAVLLGVVVPRFAALLADTGGTLPASTRLLLAVSGVVARGWWGAALLGIGAGAALRSWLREPANRRAWDAMRLRWPLLGDLERNVAAAHFTRTFAQLLASGMAAVPALRLARTAVGNAAIAASLERAEADVREGGRLAPALEGTLPPLAVQFIAAGEESGQLAELSARAAEAHERETRRALRSLVALVEPVTIIGFAFVVGFVALAMLQAIYGIGGGDWGLGTG